MGRATDKQVEEWVERYNLGLAGHEARVAFEDAQSTEADPLLAPSLGAGLPEGCNATAWFSPMYGLTDDDPTVKNIGGCTPVEIHPIGFGAELAALRAPTERGAEGPKPVAWWCDKCQWPFPNALHFSGAVVSFERADQIPCTGTVRPLGVIALPQPPEPRA